MVLLSIAALAACGPSAPKPTTPEAGEVTDAVEDEATDEAPIDTDDSVEGDDAEDEDEPEPESKGRVSAG